MQSVLILDAAYRPVSIVPARRAVALMLSGRASALDTSETSYTTAGGEERNIPFVILLDRVVKVHKRIKPPRFSRRGVLARDKNICAYCSKHATTIDHVWPRDLGGKSTYENCVAACHSCNNKKDNKTLQQIGWKLQYVPRPPTSYNHFLVKAKAPEFHAWEQYLANYSY